ncbi:hypothetical protein HYU16_04920 [Candidatus Woesearchaeota archaeon]|nr:hypothetical protein [Candidatus Woesearchaeota archaeon]
MSTEINVRLFEALQKQFFKPATLVVGFTLLFSLIFFRPLIASLFLIALGAVSIIYKRWVSIGIDLELCSLCAVAVGLTYGSTAGALSGGISMLLALSLNGHALENPFFAAIKIGTVAGLGILASIFAASNLVLIAGIYTFVADAIFVAIALQTGGNAGKLFVFLITHTPILLYQLKLLLPLAKAVL